MLTPNQIADFQQNGFLVLPQLATGDYCAEVLAFARQQLEANVPPVELEVETGYIGAPTSKTELGGETVRRLLHVSLRGNLISDWATGSALVDPLKQLLSNQTGDAIKLSQVHHNCIMTKQPRFSSVTGWHRDSRYWQFQRAELISAWLALRNETIENGCLLVIPGSHRHQVEPAGLDEKQFLRADYPANRALLAQAVAVPLVAGDVLLFSSNLFHAAGKNQTDQTKFSMVFTYRALDNPPIPGSRSDSLPEVTL